ncbi:hypothetical protein AVEN_32352-1 [Araneus ventricosus]|uniref:DUF4371 domain-containing protein n=1 Tax=Araneus ventricosus TaxID=182803 RepID=A0A4Y2FLW1_ARAVE|nr:hypothetical protein AVEN_32352-1 [Araneus ventricosus]
MHEQLSAHEKSSNHMTAYQLCVEFSKKIKQGRTVNSENQKKTQMKDGHWREVLKRSVNVVEFLASQTKKRTERNTVRQKETEFLKLLAIIRKFSVVSTDHLIRATSNESHIHYREKTMKKEIIELLGSKIEE